MSEMITIEGKLRHNSGKNYNRKLRRAGQIPANINTGSATTSTLIEIDPKWISKVWQSGKQFNLLLEGNTRAVEIKEIHINPVKRDLYHLDLAYL